MAQGRSTEITSSIKWIRTSRLSIKNSFSAGMGEAEQYIYMNIYRHNHLFIYVYIHHPKPYTLDKKSLSAGVGEAEEYERPWAIDRSTPNLVCHPCSASGRSQNGTRMARI